MNKTFVAMNNATEIQNLSTRSLGYKGPARDGEDPQVSTGSPYQSPEIQDWYWNGGPKEYRKGIPCSKMSILGPVGTLGTLAPGGRENLKF